MLLMYIFSFSSNYINIGKKKNRACQEISLGVWQSWTHLWRCCQV